ncbi:hypothetical protein LK533_14945 [Sphingomonas sp. PL-96]|uniref:hypothetical protein n=1 Tax=Sphingomonas sp. PL-96 TaxID=2887201 RepID=UPI001E527541|nr:hypothetical protein [Sphingomonas sp. PL-96]MCC2977963.1 hypothetical protein [Sphingomonas sp. PL-96]
MTLGLAAVTSAWLQTIAALVVGFAVGLRVDTSIARRERRLDNEPTVPAITVEAAREPEQGVTTQPDWPLVDVIEALLNAARPSRVSHSDLLVKAFRDVSDRMSLHHLTLWGRLGNRAIQKINSMHVTCGELKFLASQLVLHSHAGDSLYGQVFVDLRLNRKQAEPYFSEATALSS